MVKIKVLLSVLALVLTFVVSSCGVSPGTQNRDTSDYARSETSEERKVSQRLVQLTNEHRAKLGLNKLSKDGYVKNLAMEHSLYIAKNHKGTNSIRDFAHAGVHQRAEVLRIKKTQTLGENVAWHNGYANSVGDQLFQTLLDSKSHRKAIEQKNWKKMGVSVAKRGSTFYATQLFTRPYIKPVQMPQMLFL